MLFQRLKSIFPSNAGRTSQYIPPDDNVIDLFDEESRQNIYQWSAKRVKKEQKSYCISFNLIKLLKTFFDGITLMVILSIALTYVRFNFQASIIVSPLVFPLSFLIRGDFQRRERALEFLADFRSSIYSIFLLCREWRTKLGISENVVKTILNKLLQIIVHVREYLQTRSRAKRAFIVQIIYEDISDLTQLIELYHDQKISGVVSLISRLQIIEQTVIASFEKLRVIRDYRSPRSARSFAKCMMFITPILFSPLYNSMGQDVDGSKNWTPYVFGAITAFVFGVLQSVQDRLDDPFLGVTYDEINLDDLHTWANESLKRNAGRTDIIGRFTVKSDGSEPHEPSDLKTSHSDDLLQSHPFLSALNAASSVKTIRVTQTHEIPGRNRVFFIRNIPSTSSEEHKSQQNPPQSTITETIQTP